MAQPISFGQINRYQAALANDPASKALSKATQNVGPDQAARGPLNDKAIKPAFSLELSTGAVTNQKQSGRCWLFSELNTMRHFAGEKLGLKDLEFSQAFLAFYDRIEKANLFLEHVIELKAASPTEDRTLAELLKQPDGDGGQFDNAPALIEKYGIVPKSVMPETYNSSKTGEVNSVLNLKLRQAAAEIQKAAQAGQDDDALRALKQEQLSEIYRVVAYAYGNPPASFDFSYRDDKNNFHEDRGLTPKTFYEKYVGWDLSQFVLLVADPRPTKQYYQAYTLPSQNTVVGGRPIIFVNVPREDLQAMAISQLQAGAAVWFGNDVGQDVDRDTGTLTGGLYDYSTLFGFDVTMPLAERFATREAAVTHAMTLTGVNLENGQPTRWKVENSWGKERGNDGYYVADQDWFEKYAYEVAIRKDLLSEKILAATQTTPIALEAWDELN
ncbi:aminopeptidase C [Lacticaseibacillus salsurivasis]|uniref:aminopeptidase C n=1 Tax=Lacticaseibacillus salsurivasis TaxID=3081441 RepID=UPI0030C73CD9